MLNIFKTSFHLTNYYIILATPLILFSLLSSLYLVFSVNGSLISLLIAFILFVLMFGAFLSGWFFMIKNSMTTPLKDNPNSLIKEFPSGVCEYILPTLGMLIIVGILMAISSFGTFYLGMKLIGDIGIQAEDIQKAMESTVALKTFLTSLSETQLLKLNAWNLLIMGSLILTYFFIMFYPTALFFKTKNPLKAFWFGLKDLFSRKFFKNVFFYFLIIVSYCILMLLITLMSMNTILHFIGTILNFYYVVLVSNLLFNYYYENYIKIGGNIDERV